MKHLKRRILRGNYGIGKSSNQLLASILTNYVYQFRREGEGAQKDLKEIIEKNANLLQ